MGKRDQSVLLGASTSHRLGMGRTPLPAHPQPHGSLEQGGEAGLSTLLVITSVVTHGIDDQDSASAEGPALLDGR